LVLTDDRLKIGDFHVQHFAFVLQFFNLGRQFLSLTLKRQSVQQISKSEWLFHWDSKLNVH